MMRSRTRSTRARSYRVVIETLNALGTSPAPGIEKAKRRVEVIETIVCLLRLATTPTAMQLVRASLEASASLASQDDPDDAAEFRGALNRLGRLGGADQDDP